MDDLTKRATRFRRRGQRGFTLIELLVVIAILGVLAAIVVINVTGVKGNAQDAACKADTQTIQTAIDGYYVGQQPNVYPVSPSDLASPSPGDTVNIAELTGTTNPYLQATPPSGETFKYASDNGTVNGYVSGSTTPCATG